MGIISKPKVKQKKHGKKKFVRVSNKKAVKNGRQQPKPKVKAVKKVVKTFKESVVEDAFVFDEAAMQAEIEAELDADDVFGDPLESDVIYDEPEHDGQ